MRIQLERIRRERVPFRWEETVEIDPRRLEREELLALGPVTWRGRILWASPGYLLTADLETELTLACDRCLEPIVQPVREGIELLLVVDAPQAIEGEQELSEEDLGILHLDGEVFDTEPLLIEQLQLSIPMKPVCRPDCKGLCPICGTDRNRGTCDCRTESVDPRWAALAKWKPGS